MIIAAAICIKRKYYLPKNCLRNILSRINTRKCHCGEIICTGSECASCETVRNLMGETKIKLCRCGVILDSYCYNGLCNKCSKFNYVCILCDCNAESMFYNFSENSCFDCINGKTIKTIKSNHEFNFCIICKKEVGSEFYDIEYCMCMACMNKKKDINICISCKKETPIEIYDLNCKLCHLCIDQQQKLNFCIYCSQLVKDDIYDFDMCKCHICLFGYKCTKCQNYVKNHQFNTGYEMCNECLPKIECMICHENSYPKKICHKCNKNAKNEFKKACKSGKIEVVKQLLSMVDVTFEDNYCVRWAARNGHEDIVKVLIINGADPTVLNNWALNWAVKNNFLKVVIILVRAGANVKELKSVVKNYIEKHKFTEMLEYINFVENDQMEYINLNN